MIYAKNTPNNMGVAIYGDYMDFENLYEALHNVAGDEEENDGYYSSGRPLYYISFIFSDTSLDKSP